MKFAIVLLACLSFVLGNPHPRDQISDNTHFLLFTSGNPDAADEVIPGDVGSLGNFNAANNVKIIVHGYTESGDSNWMPEMKDAFLAREPDLNVIIVDWGRLANGLYGTAVDNTEPVGLYISQLVSFLIQEGSTYDTIHLIGFSLGGQIVGFTGKDHNGRISRVTGLDPAHPYYENTDESGHLDPSDGVFVDIIHTNSGELLNGGFSFLIPVGHVDFYPNGGERQPGCHDPTGPIPDLTTICSHMRCPNLFIETIKDTNAFDGYPCASYEEYGTGNCQSCGVGGCPKMGYNVRTSDSGVHYLATRENEPRDGKQVFVSLQFAANQNRDHGHIFLTLESLIGSDTAEVLNEDTQLDAGLLIQKAIAITNGLKNFISGKIAFEKDGIIDGSSARIDSIEVSDSETGDRVCSGAVNVNAGGNENIVFAAC